MVTNAPINLGQPRPQPGVLALEEVEPHPAAVTFSAALAVRVQQRPGVVLGVVSVCEQARNDLVTDVRKRHGWISSWLCEPAPES